MDLKVPSEQSEDGNSKIQEVGSTNFT